MLCHDKNAWDVNELVSMGTGTRARIADDGNEPMRAIPRALITHSPGIGQASLSPRVPRDVAAWSFKWCEAPKRHC